MVLMMACELTFSTPTGRGTFPNCRLWGWGSYGPLGAATRSPRRRRPFHFYRLAFLPIRKTRVLPDRTDDETGLTPDTHSKNGKSPKFYRQFFWRF